MGKRSKKSKVSISSGSKDSSSDMGMHLAETSWRVALPFIVLSIGGIKLDERYKTSPLFSILGVLLAVVTVSIVVYRYVNQHYPETFKGIRNDK